MYTDAIWLFLNVEIYKINKHLLHSRLSKFVEIFKVCSMRALIMKFNGFEMLVSGIVQ